MDAGYLGTQGDDVMQVPVLPDTNTYLAGLAGNDVLIDQASYHFSLFNALYGGSGNDVYVTTPRSCAFIGDTGGIDTLSIPFTLNTFLWQFHDDGDLSVIDGSHLYLELDDYELFIQDFQHPQHAIEFVQFNDVVLPFADVFAAIRYELEYDSSYEFDPRVRQTLHEAMVLRDTLAAQESGSSGGVPPSGGGGVPPSGGGNVPPSGGGGVPPQVAYYDDAQYLTAKTAQMVGWSTTQVQDAISSAGMSNRQHFEQCGAFEKNNLGEYGIDPSTHFDASKYYLWKQSIMQRDGNNISMAELVTAFKSAGLDPLSHYANFGYNEGVRVQEVRSDNIDGMTEWNEAKYYAANPDVANVVALGLIGCGFEHYALYGQFEGRSLG